MVRDLRRYARNTTIRIALGFLLLLLLVGDGLIYLIYGPGAALSGLLCIFTGLVPLGLIALGLLLLDLIVKKSNER